MRRDDPSDPAHRSAHPEPAADSAASDVALLCGPTADGRGVNVLRCRKGLVSAGAVRPLHEGQPIHGEVVRLKPRPEAPGLCDVEVEYASPAPPSGPRKGPAQVASDSYRKNWDAIFEKRRPELAN